MSIYSDHQRERYSRPEKWQRGASRLDFEALVEQAAAPCLHTVYETYTSNVRLVSADVITKREVSVR